MSDNEYNKINDYIDYKRTDNFGQTPYEEEIMRIQREMLLHTKIAHMNEVVCSDNNNYIVGTTALDTCWGIIFYDRKNKNCIVGHVCPPDVNWILPKMLKIINPSETVNVEFQLIPGYRAVENKDFKTDSIILDMLQTYSSIFPKIKFIPLASSLDVENCNGLLAYEFAFDAKNGKSVTDFVFYEPKSSIKLR